MGRAKRLSTNSSDKEMTCKVNGGGQALAQLAECSLSIAQVLALIPSMAQAAQGNTSWNRHTEEV